MTLKGDQMTLWDFFWTLIWYCFVGAYLVMVARGSGTAERQVGGDPIAGAEAIEVGTGPAGVLLRRIEDRQRREGTEVSTDADTIGAIDPPMKAPDA